MAEDQLYVNSVNSSEHDDDTSEIEMANTTPIKFDRRSMVIAQRGDVILQQVDKWMRENRKPTNAEIRGKPADLQYWKSVLETIKRQKDGMLVQEVETFMGKQVRILVPWEMREEVFHASHSHRSAGHFGIKATLARMKKRFIYPGMMTDVETRTKVCNTCVAKLSKENLKAGKHVPNLSGFPLATVYIDLVGPLNPTNLDHKYILSVEDGFSRYVELYPLKKDDCGSCQDPVQQLCDEIRRACQDLF